jgi:molecular chaperone Hsp33
VAGAIATVRRSVLREREALFATGDFSSMFRAWHEHALRWELDVDGLGEIMMHQALAGAALQLAFRVPEESTAWTLNFSQPAANVFVSGGGVHNTLTGRYYTEGVEDTGFNRLFVQRAHPRKETQRSVLQVEGLDLLIIFEQFFRDSEQTMARIVEHSPTRFSMVLPLPQEDPSWLSGLDPDGIARLEQETEALDQRDFVFRCGCSPEKVAVILSRMFVDQADEFFKGEPIVEAICPRCGARHLLDRETFDRMAEGR